MLMIFVTYVQKVMKENSMATEVIDEFFKNCDNCHIICLSLHIWQKISGGTLAACKSEVRVIQLIGHSFSI